jgi:hypothetical protein
MYRDDPLDDEAELREVLGHDDVDALLVQPPAADDERTPLLAALDVLRVLQGWVDDDDAGRWFTSPQRRLGDRSPVMVLASGAYEDVEDAARAYVAANS